MNCLYRHEKILYDKLRYVWKNRKSGKESFGDDNKFEFCSKNIFGYSD